MSTPVLEINLKKIAHNVKQIKDSCTEKGIDPCIVTKGFCALPPIVKTIVSSGINFLADSRIQNIIKVKNAFPNIRYMLIRIPKISEAYDVINYADISLQSQLEIMKVYSDKALKLGKIHEIILMVDVGDLREGVMPTVENSKLLVNLKKEIEYRFNIKLKYISGGSTCATKLLFEDSLPKEINNLRIGEAVILGEDSTNGVFIDGLYQDAFILKAEVVELKDKPSVPIGEIGYDAFGCKPTFIDKGIRKRVILSVGRQDVRLEALTPIYDGMEIIGGSSDHLLADITDCHKIINSGDVIPFRCAYSAVLTLTTSPYVYKSYENEL